MKRGRISAVELILLGDGGRPVARGVMPIDVDEGPPAIIAWCGCTFLRVAGLHVYQKARVHYADARFEAVS